MTANNPSYGPQYYNRGSIEVWDFIRDQGLNYHLGNVVKYVCRAGHKKTVGNPEGNPIEDLSKAIHYLSNELENVSHHYSGSTPNIPEHSSKGVPFDVSGWKFDQPRESEPAKGSDS